MIDIRWYSPDGKRMRIRRVSPIQTKRDAHEYERQVLLELMQSKTTTVLDKPKPKEEIPTLKDWSETFTAREAKKDGKLSGRKSKRTILDRHLLPTLGNLRLDQIRKQQLDHFKAVQRGKGLKNKTINNHLTVLRRMLDEAHQDEILDGIPRFQWLKAEDPDFDWLTEAETAELIKHAYGIWRVLIILAVRTGMRLGELRGLQTKSIDFANGLVKVKHCYARGVLGTPKNNRIRILPLEADTVAILKKHRHIRGSYFFCGENGEPIGRTTCRRHLHAICKLAGIRPIGWHTLRHSFASQLAMKGVPMPVIRELMGHATMDMTLRYAHLAPSALRDAVASLGGTNWAREK